MEGTKSSPLVTSHGQACLIAHICRHNMDMTKTFMHEASTFFVEENLPRFLRGVPLLNVVDKKAGY
jgi:hypothetical protein